MPPDQWSHVQLLEACAGAGSAEAWEEFVRRFHDLIARVALRTARRYSQVTSELLEDLVQEVYLKLCANGRRALEACSEPHPDAVFGFLKTVVSNSVHDHFKAEAAQKRGSGRTAESIDDAEARLPNAAPKALEGAEKEVLLRQIDDALSQTEAGELTDRDRNIFWLYYMQGWTTKAIAEIPAFQLTAKGVESTILRATRLVREKLAGGLQARRNTV